MEVSSWQMGFGRQPEFDGWHIAGGVLAKRDEWDFCAGGHTLLEMTLETQWSSLLAIAEDRRCSHSTSG
jgi:hypothetical protein